jgi:hypothetical protein
MERPETAREALIVEALGEVALLLVQVEKLRQSMEPARVALSDASALLAERLVAFEAGMSAITQQVRASTIEHIVRRSNEAASRSIEQQARAMNSAARLAFSAEADSNLAHLIESLEKFLLESKRSRHRWLSHAATAFVASALTSALFALWIWR